MEPRDARRDPPPTREGRASPKEFGARVIHYRERAGLSQAALAAASNVSQPAISFIEAGQRSPSIESACAIAAALGVTVGALLGESLEGLSADETALVRAVLALPPAHRADARRCLEAARAKRQDES